MSLPLSCGGPRRLIDGYLGYQEPRSGLPEDRDLVAEGLYAPANFHSNFPPL